TVPLPVALIDRACGFASCPRARSGSPTPARATATATSAARARMRRGLMPHLRRRGPPPSRCRTVRAMEFRRIPDLPPYVFAAVDELKRELRRAGEDVIDLGFGNPDLASPAVVVDKLAEAARIPRNHRHSSSRGIPRLGLAICERYEQLWGVRLDPETQAVTTIGAKEGLAHLLWTLGRPGG